MPKVSEVTLFEKMARTRGQKDGHLFERSGSWLLRYWVDSADQIDETTGKPRRERVTVTIAPAKGSEAIGKREARKIAREEYLAPVNAANMRPSSAKPLTEFVSTRFYPDYLPTLKPSGRVFYKAILGKHVLPILGPVKLREISVERVQALLTLKGKTHSTQTVRHIRNCLSAVLRHAKAMGWFYGELPTTGVRLPEMKREERKAPTWDQVCALSRSLSEPCSTLVLFLAVTGLRIGEAMGLRWQHVNLTDSFALLGTEILPPRCVAVRENYVLGQYSTLKTKGSVRNVPIPGWFVPRLASLSGRGSSDSPVFANASGSAPIYQHNLAARVLKPAARKLGMPWLSWHCLRHANATLADQAGISVIERQKLLGHATTDVALHYTHADLERVRGRMEAMVDPSKLADFGQQSVPELQVSSETIH